MKISKDDKKDNHITGDSFAHLEAVPYRSTPPDDVLHERQPVIPHLVRVAAAESVSFNIKGIDSKRNLFL